MYDELVSDFSTDDINFAQDIRKRLLCMLEIEEELMVKLLLEDVLTKPKNLIDGAQFIIQSEKLYVAIDEGGDVCLYEGAGGVTSNISGWDFNVDGRYSLIHSFEQLIPCWDSYYTEIDLSDGVEYKLIKSYQVEDV
jgi:hypothetical protein